MSTATEPRPSTDPADPTDTAENRSSRPGRHARLLATGALLLLAAAAAYAIYVLTSSDNPAEPPVPTAAVTYSVTGTGTADITYLATSETGTATTEKAAALPWKKTVQVPLGQEPVVKIQLPQQGGTATCALAVRDQHQQRATASGPYGRTTCAAVLPAEGR
ncbi:hypothetical protein OG897_15975 [Streptomyces sp. NBC_00237]|uniref:hypothetical protein n=1 Tax=Streptomyces sp. NBC_00237 TaxID=2975687 RepID=UPI002251F85A|nr:hypothetical protein [Streptomyces sp. NBC_00237]MCX5202942.1 hypothetical protein [Streptomyces sp. NBC_00237]